MLLADAAKKNWATLVPDCPDNERALDKMETKMVSFSDAVKVLKVSLDELWKQQAANSRALSQVGQDLEFVRDQQGTVLQRQDSATRVTILEDR